MALDESSQSGQEEGAVVGKYRLVERLGSGAFGAVWRAWDTELDRYVALKLLHAGGILGSVGVSEAAGVRRVMSEAQAAAGLDHPNVVKIHAAGRLPDGRAFIDAQLVGDAAPTASDAHRVAVGVSLEQQVAGKAAGRDPRWAATAIEAIARGVASAHARGVVHRDIKPANIIVTPSGRPMLADFGLSALTVLPGGVPVTAGTVGGGVAGSMHVGRVTGTPAFMSPEQARGERATPASDIYSLGATLRYLLTGELPVKPTGKHSTEARADVLEQLRRGQLGGLERAMKQSGAALPLSLVRICDRAMAAKVEDRYGSALAMAEDLASWLRRRPTMAGRESVGRRVWMWYTRNAAVATIVAAALVVFGVMVQQHVVRLGVERDRAVRAEVDAHAKQLQAEESARLTKLAEAQAVAKQKEAEESARLTKLAEAQAVVKQKEAERSARIAVGVSRVMAETLSAAQADEGARRITMFDAVTRASDRMTNSSEPGPNTDPLVEAGVRFSMGRVLGTMGEFSRAETHFRRTIEIRTSELGPDDPDTLQAEFGLAEMLSYSERSKEALEVAEPLLTRAVRLLGEDDLLTLSIKDVLGQARLDQGDAAGAERMMKEALAARMNAIPLDESRVATGHSMLGSLAKATGRRDDAIKHMQAALEIRERLTGRNSLDCMGTINDLGSVYAEMGDVARAEPLQREAYAWMEKNLGPRHVNTLNSGYNVAWMLLTKKKAPAESLAIAAPLASVAEVALGKDNPVSMRTRMLEARGLAGTGQFAAAEPIALELIARAEKTGIEGMSTRIAGGRVMIDCCKAKGDTEGEKSWRERTQALIDQAKAAGARSR
jgi:serine/threonine-protein kinase